MNCREYITSLLNESLTLRTLQLPPDSVFQAETARSPEQRPFIVLRWLAERPGMGRVRIRPLDIWVYDELGDYARAEKIGNAALALLEDIEQEATDDGWILKVDVSGAGLGQDRDMRDEGFNALVIPYHTRVVASGS